MASKKAESFDGNPFHIEDVLKHPPTTYETSHQQRRSSQDVVDSLARSRSIIPPPMRRSTSFGDECAAVRIAARSGSNHHPRDTGRRYLIRERKEGDDLMANLLSLRKVMLNQQDVHA